MTMVVVTHEISPTRCAADRVVVFERGRIAEQGPSMQIFAAPRTDRMRAFPSHLTWSG